MIVCEAFVGNVILKLYEGLSGTLIGAIKKGMMSTVKSKIGAALALPALKSTLKTFDATQYGGAPLLGLNGLVVKTHGSAKRKRDYEFYFPVCDVQGRGHQWKDREKYSKFCGTGRNVGYGI